MPRPQLHEFNQIFPGDVYTDFNRDSLATQLVQEIELAWEKVGQVNPPFSDSTTSTQPGILTEKAMAALYRAAHNVASSQVRDSGASGFSQSVGGASITKSGEVINTGIPNNFNTTSFGRAYLSLLRENKRRFVGIDIV